VVLFLSAVAAIYSSFCLYCEALGALHDHDGEHRKSLRKGNASTTGASTTGAGHTQHNPRKGNATITDIVDPYKINPDGKRSLSGGSPSNGRSAWGAAAPWSSVEETG
jgi:hypothetical protein